MKKLLFITTLNLATNPRLVKEIRLALALGYEITVICFSFNNWSYSLNETLLREFENQIKVRTIPAGRKPLIPWLLGVVFEKGARLCGRMVGLPLPILAVAVTRRSFLLKRGLQKIGAGFDLVIGHNPGALYATLCAKKKFNCRAGFDVEDYHPGEGNNRQLQQHTKELMTKILTEMDYVSFASPLIRDAVIKDHTAGVKNPLTILNYFSGEEFVQLSAVSGPLKLVWFSQNINFNRGLELIVPVVSEFPGAVELHLVGRANEDFKSRWLQAKNIFIHDPLSQAALHYKLKDYDIGLALEPGKDENNQLAVSNKLLAYLQAGLYIVATPTPAQDQFIKEHECHGTLLPSDEDRKKEFFRELIARKEQIRSERVERYKRAKENCWETESEKLKNVWEMMVDGR